MSSIDAATARQYVESGWWGTDPLHEIVRVQAVATPERSDTSDRRLNTSGRRPRSSGGKFGRRDIRRVALESVTAASSNVIAS
ncbi:MULTISPECIES: hypothetical protein [unclassified Rhodococcus (in: high G+C Gram-positive bacteria)]|uniref:hypothetical protein n=1 Tax=Rhodococcus sp. SJ-3 TaxID=3454628 RepID=UPI003F7B104C